MKKATKALPAPALVPEVLPPCQDLGDFLRRLVALQQDARRLDWSDPHDFAARVNALTLLDLLIADIADDRAATDRKGG